MFKKMPHFKFLPWVKITLIISLHSRCSVHKHNFDQKVQSQKIKESGRWEGCVNASAVCFFFKMKFNRQHSQDFLQELCSSSYIHSTWHWLMTTTDTDLSFVLTLFNLRKKLFDCKYHCSLQQRLQNEPMLAKKNTHTHTHTHTHTQKKKKNLS